VGIAAAVVQVYSKPGVMDRQANRDKQTQVMIAICSMADG